MSLLYWTMLPWLLAAPPSPSSPSPTNQAARPLLLLADPCQTGLEQQVVGQALVHELLERGEVQLVVDAPVSSSQRASAALRQAGARQLTRGWAHMRALHPEGAAVCAAMAAQKLSRVAARSGDVSLLLEAMALQAAAYLHAGSPAAAERVLCQLLALRREWVAEGWLYNPEMQRAVARARRGLHGVPTRMVTVRTHAPRAAVFVNGVFAGFGDVGVELPVGLPHYFWAVAPRGEGVGTRLVVTAAHAASAAAHAPPAAAETNVAADDEGWSQDLLARPDDRISGEPRSRSGQPLTVHLAPRHWSDQAAADARYASVFAAARAKDGLVDPTLPILAAAAARDVWVLAYASGELTLTCFDLDTGTRTTRRTGATMTHLGEARTLARRLLLRDQVADANVERADAPPSSPAAKPLALPTAPLGVPPAPRGAPLQPSLPELVRPPAAVQPRPPAISEAASP